MRLVTRFPLALLLFSALALASAPAAAQDDAPAPAVKTYSDTVPLDADGRVRIDTYKGSVTITTWDRAEVQYDIRVEPAEDPEAVAQTEVKIDRSDRSIRFESDYDDVEGEEGESRFFGLIQMNSGSRSLPFVHYTLTIPRTATLQIDDYKSEIDVRDVAADVDLETYKGEIDLANLDGDLNLNTYKGTGEIEGLRGDLRLDTYKGRIEVEGLAGSARVDTYKGDVELDFVAFEDDTEVDTYKGDVRFTLPEGTGFDLDTDFGDRADLDADFPTVDLRAGDHDYRGPVNGGGPELELSSYKGSFEIRLR
jgi:DUF4097 and DUF4098 domain-containing protein YvlB